MRPAVSYLWAWRAGGVIPAPRPTSRSIGLGDEAGGLQLCRARSEGLARRCTRKEWWGVTVVLIAPPPPHGVHSTEGRSGGLGWAFGGGCRHQADPAPDARPRGGPPTGAILNERWQQQGLDVPSRAGHGTPGVGVHAPNPEDAHSRLWAPGCPLGTPAGRLSCGQAATRCHPTSVDGLTGAAHPLWPEPGGGVGRAGWGVGRVGWGVGREGWGGWQGGLGGLAGRAGGLAGRAGGVGREGWGVGREGWGVGRVGWGGWQGGLGGWQGGLGGWQGGLGGWQGGLGGWAGRTGGVGREGWGGWQGGLGGLAGRAGGLAGRAGGLAGRAGGLEGRAGGLAGRAGGLAGRAGGLAGWAGGLAGRAGGLAGRAGGLAGRAGGLAGRAGGVARAGTEVGVWLMDAVDFCKSTAKRWRAIALICRVNAPGAGRLGVPDLKRVAAADSLDPLLPRAFNMDLFGGSC